MPVALRRRNGLARAIWCSWSRIRTTTSWLSTHSRNVSHGNLRQLTGAGGYCLRYWHHGADGGPYTTDNGWSPLKVAFKAITYKGDDRPR
ncbi:hypothetical protein [Saccharopolyspora spinosa]|uniref:Uncharacterized protein n=1 Tax=Saccharopolyspora spinosa TaxID=60894 RepID=A0A2N3Y1N6_SACSN|nr:hypothetical protein [Saccharopolyspora spinosa]PKW16815.1 hypothetical protein A8926_4706 [Saccharopolyspora spinosa]